MLAILYLLLAAYLGDLLCRRFYCFVSLAQRWASAVQVGLLISTVFTYLAAYLCSRSRKPLLWADLLFLAFAALAIFFLQRNERRTVGKAVTYLKPPAAGSAKWDWVFLAIYLAVVSWMMFATFSTKDGTLLIGNNEWSDFGPNTAIAQSFAVGHNFPTEYPHFSGEPIRYHFLFYFQVGNLTYLGLNLAWSLNLLSILSLVSMLSLVMALGQLLFASRAVGRIGSALFFFHGSLSFLPFLRAQPSLSEAFRAILRLKDFLPSGYPYRGELWGIWTQVVFLNQRHFSAGIGILLVVLLFLVARYQRSAAPAISSETPLSGVTTEASTSLHGFIFCGLLLGLLPFWNALVFTSAFAILFGLFVLFPLRKSMVALGLTTAVVSLPQLLMLREGGNRGSNHSLLHWGYVIEPPTFDHVVRYLGFTFGLKWFLILIALVFLSWFHRRLFLALCVLYANTFCLQLSVETLANHKFLNVWLIVGNLFAAYGLWQLWHLRGKGFLIAGRSLALVLGSMLTIGGVIDLFPIHNSYNSSVKYQKDLLVDWIRLHTRPRDIFLTDRFVNHPILMAGRPLFYGWPSFPWSSGYDTDKRDRVYRQLFESRDGRLVYQLLHENHIAYVAIDNGVRHGEFIKRANEDVYAKFFPKVFVDKTNSYSALTIYRVPPDAPANLAVVPNRVPASVFVGGKGTNEGEFDMPRGLTVDRFGNFLVSDSGNGRIQRFSAAGGYLNTIGHTGSGDATLTAPDGIIVDETGLIYVADVGTQTVRKLSPTGTLLAQWTGPAPGFYGPRDLCFGPGRSIFVVDQGRARIVRLTREGQVLTTWGSPGKEDGQFNEPTSVVADVDHDRVYVADPRNQRIQVFDTNGKFIMKWTVEEWKPDVWLLQHLVLDHTAGRLYASSHGTAEVLVFDLAGHKTGRLVPALPDKLEGASAMVLSRRRLYVLDSFSNRVSQMAIETK